MIETRTIDKAGLSSVSHSSKVVCLCLGHNWFLIFIIILVSRFLDLKTLIFNHAGLSVS